jgi:uncharacterized membrane protein (DUF485 family)
MTKVMISALVVLSITYTSFVIWMAWFTYAFFGFDAKGGNIESVIGFGLFVLSPIPVCIYCLRRAKALSNGVRPQV